MESTTGELVERTSKGWVSEGEGDEGWMGGVMFVSMDGKGSVDASLCGD